MSVETQKDSSATTYNDASVAARLPLWMLLTSWEVYLILLIAAFLRLFRIGTTEFDGDQSDIFTMAYNAVRHGHFVATSNVASIHIFNPPAIIYALMIPAAISANPVWGSVLISLLAIASILLTYIFTRKYYGRLAATIASLLYAVASVPIFYSRFMWNQNMLLFFVPLLIWFLFRGAVAHRPNWLFPSVILVALLVQFHASSIVLTASLAVAIVLAPRKTMRWYDILLSVVGVLLLYATYILWLIHTNFQDVHILLGTSNGHSIVDTQGLFFYLQFLGPFSAPITNQLSILHRYQPILSALEPIMTVLLVGGVLIALKNAAWSHSRVRGKNALASVLSSSYRWWQDLRGSPERSGLCILLSWQIIPLLYLARHDINLHLHYFIMLMPGPFILIGIFFATVFEWLQFRVAWKVVLRCALVGISVLLVLAQGAASLGYVIDASTGRFNDQTWAGQYYNDLASLQNAVGRADQLAQQHHLNHIYISSDLATQSAFLYLAGHTKTPTTVVSDSCLVLPGMQYGAAILLTAPRSNRLDLVTGVDHATPLGSMPHPGSETSFQYFVLGPLHTVSNVTTSTDNYTQNLKFVAAIPFRSGSAEQLATRWTLEDSMQSSYRTSYHYTFTRSTSGTDAATAQRQCTVDSMRAGDQLIATVGTATSTKSTLKASTFTTLPTTLSYNLMGVFHMQFDTFQLYDTPTKSLKTKAGAATITIAGT